MRTIKSIFFVMYLRRNHDDRTYEEIIDDLYVCRQTGSSETSRWVVLIAFAWCRPWASLQCPMQCPTTNPHTPLPKAQCPVPKANARCPVRSHQVGLRPGIRQHLGPPTRPKQCPAIPRCPLATKPHTTSRPIPYYAPEQAGPEVDATPIGLDSGLRVPRRLP